MMFYDVFVFYILKIGFKSPPQKKNLQKASKSKIFQCVLSGISRGFLGMPFQDSIYSKSIFLCNDPVPSLGDDDGAWSFPEGQFIPHQMHHI